ncbi:MAG: helix-turn-helix domain-containing protein [Muribaculaceae bacterium]|nr:helix-turn-helix domain-containing protein [Muribaculaceae bacterium]
MNLRYGLLIPLVMMISSIVSGFFAYSDARQDIADDLNVAMEALVKEKSGLWTRQDTIDALRHMYEVDHKPMIYQASDLKFRNSGLKDVAYYSLALVDRKTASSKIRGNKIASDSIMLVLAGSVDGLAIQVQGFADCSMASVFAVSDQTVPGVLFSLAIFSLAGMYIWRRNENCQLATEPVVTVSTVSTLDGIKLTPMQRQLAQMLLDAPDMKVDKATLCTALWGNKSNAEESLYTLVRRTKSALAESGIEIICNRGDSYQLRVNG